MKIRIYQSLESLFAWMAEHAENTRQFFAICPQCKANRYTGKPCIK